MTVSCRPATPEDDPFLRKTIIDSVAAELGAEAWPEPIRTHLLEIQNRGKRRSGGLILTIDGEDVGWLLQAETEDEIQIVEIIVARPMRGHGVGSAALGQVLEKARRQGKPVRLHVDSANTRAIAL